MLILSFVIFITILFLFFLLFSINNRINEKITIIKYSKKSLLKVFLGNEYGVKNLMDFGTDEKVNI
jgi:hypothetical protein